MFMKHFAEFFLQWEKFQIKVVEKMKCTFHVKHSFSENLDIYEIMKYTAQPYRPEMI